MSHASLWTALSVVYGFVQAKALKLRFPPTIVHPAPCYGLIAFMCDVVRFSWDFLK